MTDAIADTVIVLRQFECPCGGGDAGSYSRVRKIDDPLQEACPYCDVYNVPIHEEPVMTPEGALEVIDKCAQLYAEIGDQVLERLLERIKP